MPRIAITGAAASGKGKLAVDLASRLEGHTVASTTLLETTELAIGEAADYRVELAILGERLMYPQRDVIGVGTELMSEAYMAARLGRMAAARNVSDETIMRWAALLEVTHTTVIDTFDYDVIFFLPTTSDDEFDITVENALLALFETFEISYTIIDDPLQQLDECVRIVEEAIGGVNGATNKGTDSSEPSAKADS